jgi:hypothetical protein
MNEERGHFTIEEKGRVTNEEKVHFMIEEKVHVIIEVRPPEGIIAMSNAIKLMRVQGIVALKCLLNINAAKGCVILKGIDVQFSKDLLLLKDLNRNLLVFLN